MLCAGLGLLCTEIYAMPLAEPLAATHTWSGSGTQTDPYLISNSDQLKELADLVNSKSTNPTYANKYYKQTADIDLNGGSLEPIGDYYNTPFKGNYNGGGYSISNFDVTTYSSTCMGFIGYASNATIENVSIISASISKNKDGSCIGGIVGSAYNSLVLRNCSVVNSDLSSSFVEEQVDNDYSENGAYAGGETSAEAYVGGLVGYCYGSIEIEDCSVQSSSISIIVKSAFEALAESTESDYAESEAEAGAYAYAYTGGFVGWVKSGSSIKIYGSMVGNCEIYGESYAYAYAEAFPERSYSNAYAYSKTYVGGIIGYAYNGYRTNLVVEIDECCVLNCDINGDADSFAYAYSSTDEGSDVYVGDLVGYVGYDLGYSDVTIQLFDIMITAGVDGRNDLAGYCERYDNLERVVVDVKDDNIYYTASDYYYENWALVNNKPLLKKFFWIAEFGDEFSYEELEILGYQEI